MITQNTIALVCQNKEQGFSSFGFWTPYVSFPKIPVSLDILLDRIRSLANQYNIAIKLRTYPANASGIAAAKKDMKGKGGIYIWYCRSGVKFFGTNGRLSTYLANSKLVRGELNKKLSADILVYGYKAFTLIFIEEYEEDSITSKQLRTQEQLWMLLYYNSTLSVGFAINKHITEQDRREASHTIFQYEVNANGIIPRSEQIHYGFNQITRNGFTSVDNPLSICLITN